MLYCAAPWTALFIDPTGVVKSCCAGMWEWGNLNDTPLPEILANKRVTEMKQDILNGVANDFCSTCAENERLTGRSQRQYFDDFRKDEEKFKDPTLFELRALDIRWSNLCNLNCVYCNDTWSTTWQKVKGISITSLSRPYTNDILAYIISQNGSITKVILVGGEPLLMKTNVKLIEGLMPETHIEIITNLNTDLEKSPVYEALVKHRHVSWHVSAEATGKQFEFIRQGASWDLMERNLRQIKGQFKTVNFLPVFCLFSLDNLEDFVKTSRGMHMHMHWQNLIGPMEHNIFNFSEPVRKYARDKLAALIEKMPLLDLGYKLDTSFFEQATQMLNVPPAQEIDLKFRVWLKEFEEKFNEAGTFAENWPELNALIKKE